MVFQAPEVEGAAAQTIDAYSRTIRRLGGKRRIKKPHLNGEKEIVLKSTNSGVKRGSRMKMFNESIRQWETDTRYYCAMLDTDLFGQVVLQRCWGGKKNRNGGMASDFFGTVDEAKKAMDALAKVRKQHGYRLLN